MQLPKPTKKKKIRALSYALENYIYGLYILSYTIILTIYFPIENMYRANSSSFERKIIYFLSIFIHFVVSILIPMFVYNIYNWCKNITEETIFKILKRLLLLTKIGLAIIGVYFTINIISIIITTIDKKIIQNSILLIICTIILAKIAILIRKNITYRYWYKYYTTSPDSEIIIEYVNSTITRFLTIQHPPIEKKMWPLENYGCYTSLLLPYLKREFGTDRWLLQTNIVEDFWGYDVFKVQLYIKNPKGSANIKIATLEVKFRFFESKNLKVISLEILDFDERVIYCVDTPI